MAECALGARTYARGVKIIVTKLVEDIVYDAREGTIRIGAADVLHATRGAGLAHTQPN